MSDKWRYTRKYQERWLNWNLKAVTPKVEKNDWAESSGITLWAWLFIFLLKYKAETPVLWPPQVKSWLIGKDSDAGTDWGQEEKGTTEDEMAGWYHRLDGCVWVNSGRWWWPGMLRFMGSQRVGHDWATELNWTELSRHFDL